MVKMQQFRVSAVHFLKILLLSSVVECFREISQEDKTQRVLSRKKRYVAFPEGSSLSAALCTTIGAIGNPHVDFISYAINWGVAYDLPNETWAVQAANGFKNTPTESKPAMQRRFRRELYKKIEIAMDSMGYRGRECILRALCESSKYFFKRTGNMIEELLKRIFSFPTKKVTSREHRDVHEYRTAYRIGRQTTEDCSQNYPNCGFSLLELALGKYSTRPETIYSYM